MPTMTVATDVVSRAVPKMTPLLLPASLPSSAMEVAMADRKMRPAHHQKVKGWLACWLRLCGMCWRHIRYMSQHVMKPSSVSQIC